MKDDLSKNEIENISIEDENYQKYKKAYDYALEMTTREINQAIEGLYHNLNTLQSRSGMSLNIN